MVLFLAIPAPPVCLFPFSLGSPPPGRHRSSGRFQRQPRSQRSLLPALRSERERERELRTAGRRERWERGCSNVALIHNRDGS